MISIIEGDILIQQFPNQETKVEVHPPAAVIGNEFVEH